MIPFGLKSLPSALAAAVVLAMGLPFASALRADPVLPTIPATVFNVTTYGAKGDGTTDNTTALQAAIRAAQTAGGGTVELPAAASPYLSGPLTIGSNINFQIDTGAILQLLPYGAGSNAPGTYPLSGTAYTNFLSVQGNNIALTGGGTIEGQGAAWWAAFNANNNIPHRPYMIRFNSSNFVLIKNLTFRNSPMFHVAFGATSNVTIDSVTIFCPTSSVNTDGIDPSGQHYLIKNCNISTGDDNVCLKPQSALCGDITIRDCTFGTGHGVSVGGQTNDGLDGMVVTNCTFNGTTNGLRIKADPTEGGLVQNVAYSNLTMTDVQFPIVFYSYYDQVGNPGTVSGSTQTTPARVAAWNATPPNTAYRGYATTTMPTMRNISITNLTATRTSAGADGYSTIWGLPNIPAANIVLNNVTITGYSGFEIFNARNVQLTGGTTLSGLVTYNAQIVTAPPASQVVAPGGTVTLNAPVTATAAASGPVTSALQWTLNGRALADGPQSDGSTLTGSTTSTLTITKAQTADTGFYSLRTSAALDTFASNALVAGGFSAVANSQPAAVTIGDASGPSRLVNLSARASVGAGTGPSDLTAGFVVGGPPNLAIQYLLRGIGPSLAQFGLTNVLADPSLKLFGADGQPVTSNDNWAGNASVSLFAGQVGAFPLAASSLDAAFVAGLGAANWTASLAGPAGTSGQALLELYDTDNTLTGSLHLVNISARAPVVASAGGLLAGFVIAGTAPKTVLIRGIGPGLTAFGISTALADPVLQVYTAGSGMLVASSDNWGGDPLVVAATPRAGAFPLTNLSSKDAALVITLPPGAYTANVTSAIATGTGSTGQALVEVYEVP